MIYDTRQLAVMTNLASEILESATALTRFNQLKLMGYLQYLKCHMTENADGTRVNLDNLDSKTLKKVREYVQAVRTLQKLDDAKWML